MLAQVGYLWVQLFDILLPGSDVVWVVARPKIQSSWVRPLQAVMHCTVSTLFIVGGCSHCMSCLVMCQEPMSSYTSATSNHDT